jgi:hypothetical protein
MRALILASALAGIATGVIAASAQQRPQLDPDVLRQVPIQDLDLSRVRPFQNLQVQPDQGDEPDFNSGSGYELNPGNGLWYGWVNFDQDRALGLVEGRIVNLGWREQAGGVRFGAGQREGARIVRCGAGSNTCALPQPGSPDALIASAGTLRIDFAQPVAAVSALVAPDRGFGAEPDLFVMEGWRDGDIVSVTRGDVEIYDSNAQGWTRLTLSGLAEAARATTAVTAATDGRAFDYVIIRGVTANGAETRTPIVLDALRFADRHGPTPYDSLGPRAGGLQAMLEDTRRTGARLAAQGQVVQPGGMREGMRYPAAEHMRMPVDMPAARNAAQRQRQVMAMNLPMGAGLRGRAPMTVPILAPLGIFRGEDPAAGAAEHVRFTGRNDYFHLRFDSEIGRVVISGTRIVARPQAGEQSPGEMHVSAGYDGAYASFNLYGAAYSVRVACGTEEIGAPCNDPDALRTLLDRLILWMPEEA